MFNSVGSSILPLGIPILTASSSVLRSFSLYAGVAQCLHRSERLIRNQQVGGSNPLTGSTSVLIPAALFPILTQILLDSL